MKKLSYILLLAVLALACKKDIPNAEGVDVSINLASIDIVRTKTNGSVHPLMSVGSTVRIFAYSATTLVAEKVFKVSNGEGLLKGCVVNAHGVEDEGEDPQTDVMRLPSSGTYTFTAISPAILPTEDNGSRAINVAYVSHNPSAANDSLCDLLYSTTSGVVVATASASAPAPIALSAFKHRFSQVRIELKVEAPIDGTTVTITSVTIKNQNSGPETIKMSDGNFSTSESSHTKEVKFLTANFKNKADIDATADTPKILVCESDSVIIFPTNLLAPTDKPSYVISSTVKVAHRELVLISSAITHPIQKGLEHVFTLTYTEEGIALYLTMVPKWNERVNGLYNFGNSLTFMLGGWSGEHITNSIQGATASHSVPQWTPAAEWKGDFGDGFAIEPEKWPPAGNDVTVEDEVGGA